MAGRVISVIALLWLYAAGSVAQDTLILTSPPRETEQAGQKQYEPLAQFVSKVLGQPVVYEHPGGWLKYQNDLREDKYDIVFDGPHFASWRITHLGHDALVKLPGTLQFYLLTAADNNAINSPDDLIGKKICGISPPNLSSLSILAYYRNPVRQPQIKGVKGGMGKVYKEYQAGLCEAFVLRSAFYDKKLSEDERKGLKIIYETPLMPNQVITASKRLTPEQVMQLRAALTGDEGVKATRPTLDRFARQAPAFLPASTKEYQGFNTLLEGVIFGW